MQVLAAVFLADHLVLPLLVLLLALLPALLVTALEALSAHLLLGPRDSLLAPLPAATLLVLRLPSSPPILLQLNSFVLMNRP